MLKGGMPCEFRRSDADTDSTPLAVITNRGLRKSGKVIITTSTVRSGSQGPTAEEDCLLDNGQPTDLLDHVLVADFIYRFRAYIASQPSASAIIASS